MKFKTHDVFIKELEIVHNFKYDYSKVNYIDSKTKINIICRIHGEFLQIPSLHLSGHGCRKCADLVSDPSRPSGRGGVT